MLNFFFLLETENKYLHLNRILEVKTRLPIESGLVKVARKKGLDQWKETLISILVIITCYYKE